MMYTAAEQPVFSIEDLSWDESPWKETPSLVIGNFMGTRPDHFPKAEVRIVYDTKALCLMFRVEDRYVRAIARADQDAVYKDSCVEFFFTPGSDLSLGYFNLEMNCGGTMLFHFQSRPRENRIVIPASECARIKRAHSLPRIVTPEIQEPVTWTLAYEIPYDLLEKYCPVVKPGPEAEWLVNFYKCGDDTSHPHWLTWSPSYLPKPDFHCPGTFGRLAFG